MVYQRVADRRRNDADKKAKENERLQREAFKLRNEGYWVSDIARVIGKPEEVVLNLLKNLLKNDMVKPENAVNIDTGKSVQAVHIHSYHRESVLLYINDSGLSTRHRHSAKYFDYDWLVIGVNAYGQTYATTHTSENFYKNFVVGRA